MKAVLMRVQRASVTIDERETRSIGRGFLILLAVTHDDTEAQAVKLADKLCSLRLFEDADGKINLTLDVLDRREDGYHDILGASGREWRKYRSNSAFPVCGG